jgi:hypothetical protein
MIIQVAVQALMAISSTQLSINSSIVRFLAVVSVALSASLDRLKSEALSISWPGPVMEVLLQYLLLVE